MSRTPGRRRLFGLPLLLIALTVVQFTTSSSCLAQETTIAPGERIRVKPLIRPKDRVTDSFIEVAKDTLLFDTRGDVRQLAISDIKTLQVSAGQGSHAQGTILGGLVGAVGGALVGAAVAGEDDELGNGFIGFWVGGAVGAALGWALLTPEKWVTVPLEDLQLSVGPGLIYFQFGLR